MTAANFITAAASLFRRLVLAAVEALNIPVSEPTMDALIRWERGDNPLRVRALPRLAFKAVAAAASFTGSTRAFGLLLDRAARIESLDRLSRAPWPTEYGGHYRMFKLTRLAIRPRLLLAAVAYLLAAYRDGVFIAGYTSSGSFGEQSPAVYKRHKSAVKRWLRFLWECSLPTIFIHRDYTEVHGFYVEGFDISIDYWLEGKSHHYGIGRRGAQMYEPPPADEERFFDYGMPEPELVTCPTCRGVGFEGTLDGQPVLVTKEMIEGEGYEGLVIWDCSECGGLGHVEPDDDDEPDCIRVHGGGFSTTGY